VDPSNLFDWLLSMPGDVFSRLIALTCLGPFVAIGVVILIIGLVMRARREPSRRAYKNTWRLLYRSPFLPPGYYPHPLAFREVVADMQRANARRLLGPGVGLLVGCLASGAFILSIPRLPEGPSTALLVLVFPLPALGMILGLAWVAASGPTSRDTLSRLQLLSLGLRLSPQWVVALSLVVLVPEGLATGATILLTAGRALGWLAARQNAPDSFEASQAAFLGAYPWVLWIAPACGVLLIACQLFTFSRLRATPVVRTADPHLALAAGRNWRVLSLAGFTSSAQFVGWMTLIQGQALTQTQAFDPANFALISVLMLLGIITVFMALSWSIAMLRVYSGTPPIPAPWPPPQPVPQPAPQAPLAGG